MSGLKLTVLLGLMTVCASTATHLDSGNGYVATLFIGTLVLITSWAANSIVTNERRENDGNQ